MLEPRQHPRCETGGHGPRASEQGYAEPKMTGATSRPHQPARLGRAYFERLSQTSFLPTEHVGGAWADDEQHIAPVIGLVAHAIEVDHAARRPERLELARLSCDILGKLPLEPFDLTVSVLRPGRTIELVEARLSHAGRAAVIARAWLTQPYATSEFAATPLPRILPPTELPPWDPTQVWPGGFIRSLEVRRVEQEPGRARFWVRSDVGLVAGEEVSATASALRLVDVANGMTVREPVAEVAFPNVDLTAHLFRLPAAGWTGFDTAVSFGPTGLGATTSVLHDAHGPFGLLNQCLTVRPKVAPG